MAGKLQGELQTVAEQLRRQLAAEEPQAGGDIELMQSLAGRPADIEARLREGKLVERVASLLSTGAEKLTRQAPRGAEVHRALSMPPPGLPPNSPRLTRCASLSDPPDASLGCAGARRVLSLSLPPPPTHPPYTPPPTHLP